MNIHLGVFCLWVEDVPACAHYYQEVIGQNILARQTGDRPHFDLGDCTLIIILGRPALPPDAEPRFVLVAFPIPEMDTAMERRSTFTGCTCPGAWKPVPPVGG